MTTEHPGVAHGDGGQHRIEVLKHVHLYQEDPFWAQLWYQQHVTWARAGICTTASRSV